MFSKAWQTAAFVAAILIGVVFVFGGEGEPVGFADAGDVAERAATQGETKGADEDADAASLASDNSAFDAPADDGWAAAAGWGDQSSGGFADNQIEEYDSPSSDFSASDAAPAGGSGSNRASPAAPSGFREPASPDTGLASSSRNADILGAEIDAALKRAAN